MPMSRLFATYLLLAFCWATTAAQQRLVDEVKKDIASQNMTVDKYMAAKKKLSAALTNDDTKQKAETWWVAAEIDLGIYDKAMSMRSIGKKVDSKEVGHALIDSYDNMMQSLRLDTVYQRDRVGDIKKNKNGTPRFSTKYSKRIMKNLYGRIIDFSSAGGELFIASDWDGAYRAWDIYCNLAKSPLAAQYKVNEPDTVVGYYRYYQGLAAHQNQKYREAIAQFGKAQSLGYIKKGMYDTWIEAAAKLQDTTEMVAVATAANERYGNRTTQYLRILINDCLGRKEYITAASLLNVALEKDPENAEYYDLMGQIVERVNNITDAMPYYQKAVDIDPDYALGQFNLGNAIYRKTQLIDNLSEEQARVMYAQAMEHVEKAYQLGLKSEEVKLVLSRLYYLLGSDKIDSL